MNMKKILAGTLFVLFVAIPIARAATEFKKNLFYGITGSDEVIQLQKFLTDQKLYTGPITGNFYSLTKKAVIAFQKANGINGTGYFGPLSRIKANQLLGPIVNESGAPVKTPSTPVATSNGALSTLTQEVASLQTQLTQLQKQNQTLTTIQQQQAQQTQTLQQTQQNTPPPPPQQNTIPPPPPQPSTPQPSPPQTPSLPRVYLSQDHTINNPLNPDNPTVLVFYIEAGGAGFYINQLTSADLDIISSDFSLAELNIRIEPLPSTPFYTAPGQKWAAGVKINPPIHGGSFRLVVNSLVTTNASGNPVILSGFPLTSQIITVNPPISNLPVNIEQISLIDPYYLQNTSPALGDIALFRVHYDESIILKDFSFTFNNTNPLARLYNVELNGNNGIPVIAPGNTINFSIPRTFDVNLANKTLVLKGSDAYGWNIVFNSVTVIRKNHPSLPATLTGLPISVVPRDRRVTLELLPSTPLGLIPPPPYGNPDVLILKLSNDYLNLAIKSATFLFQGQTVYDTGVSNTVTASLIEASTNVIGNKTFTSGVPVTYTYGNPGYMHSIGQKTWTTLYVRLNLSNARPGTTWQATLQNIEFIDANNNIEVIETGLPISNAISY